MPQDSLPLLDGYRFSIAKGLEKEVEEIKAIRWDGHNNARLRKGYLVELLTKRGLFEEFKKMYWPLGDSPDGEARVARYIRLKQRHLEFRAEAGLSTDDDDGVDDVDEDQSFAAERDLREFLVKHPHCIEVGLRIHEQSGRSGVEYSIDNGNGRIDILAVDREGRFVVIELKVSRGRNKTVGQLLYYMGWVDANLSNGKPCRGLIIAKEISDDLVLAVRRTSDITLCQYSLSVTVQPVVGASPGIGKP